MATLNNNNDNNAYEASVALNNMGVTLMERNLYEAAVQTFQEAIDVMKLASSSAHDDDNQQHEEEEEHDAQQQKQQQLSEQDIQQKINTLLNSASLRLTKPARQLSQLQQQQQQHVLLTVLSDSMSTIYELEDAALDFSSCYTGCVIRIDRDDRYTTIDVDSAIILLNLGTARRSINTTDDKNEWSYMYYNIGHNILSRQQHYNDYDDDDEMFVATIVHMLLVQNLMHLSFELHKQARGRKFYDILCNLREQLPSHTQSSSQTSSQQPNNKQRQVAPAA